MQFELTDEQRDLAATVRGFLADRFPLSAVRELYDDPSSDGEPAVIAKAAGEQGWLAVLVPEEHGGLGLGLLDASVLARCWGAGVVPGSMLATLVAAEAVRLAGSPEQQSAWLPRVAEGQARLSLAVGDGAPDTPDITVAVDGGTLTGRAPAVEYAAGADRLVVAATETGGGVSLWLVDPAASGVTITGHAALDRTTRLSTVDLDKVEGERLPGGDAGALNQILDRAAVLAANDLAGIAREALTRTVDYVKTREQFGRPVGSFQALKHALADLLVAVTMAEHAGWYAAYALDADLPDALQAVSVAKAKATETARDVTAAMIQFHGGIGYAWEHDAHFYFKRAKRLEFSYGDQAQHLDRVARLVVDRRVG
jgi:alkylation response protein AidB-like acyl-CoA dehydrogenase